MYTQALSAAQLRDEYFSIIKGLDLSIEKIRAEIKKHPPYGELAALEQKLELYRLERRELTATADHLAHLAAEPPVSPSLAARMRS